MWEETGMDHAVVAGQRIARPSRIARSDWLDVQPALMNDVEDVSLDSVVLFGQVVLRPTAVGRSEWESYWRRAARPLRYGDLR
jgi:hypothetical protein